MSKTLPTIAAIVLSAILLSASGAARAQWHLEGWTDRGTATITQPAAVESDTVLVRVLCQGHARPDAGDYRVLDAAGTSLPFAVLYHDAARYSLVAFRIAGAGDTYYVYYGNPQAPPAPQRVMLPAEVGSGPPRGDWTPRPGLVLTTMRRPEGDNPQSVDDLARMIAASAATDGARLQRGVSDGFNPFGSSDNYLSVYRGWLHVAQEGRYSFCTASNEASFSFLDGRELIHWAGRHTAERGIRGEKNAAVDLAAGWHYVEYYHEEVALQQMAFLGWSPPGSPEGQFFAIPEEAFPAPHVATISRYESAAGAALRFEPVIADTVWPETRHEGQYTRCTFRAAAGAEGDAGATYTWDFGDGQTGEGAEVAHVYLGLGTYQVSLSAATAQSTTTAIWPLTVYEVQHVTGLVREGSPPDYVRIVGTYDQSRLDAAALKELSHLLAESGEPALALAAGRLFVARFSEPPDERLTQVRRLMADCAIRLGEGSLDEAVANYLASLTEATPAEERFDVLARLIQLLGIERDEPQKAAEIAKQADEAGGKGRLTAEALKAYRRCVIARGDVELWHAKPDEARRRYLKAETLTPEPVGKQVRSALIGTYPNLIREYIESGDFGAALDVVNRWEDLFPSEKLTGQTFFWRGKLNLLRDQSEPAARHLARAVGLGVGAGFESEARWLLAQSLVRLGRTKDARRELAKLVALGLDDEFSRLARDQLK